MSNFTDGFKKFTEQGKETATKTVTYFKTRWIDYLLLIFILFTLGAFDFFVLQRSDEFLTAEYWNHTACRLIAYVLAGVIGVRVGYPKAQENCQELAETLEENKRLLKFKQGKDKEFGKFIYEINLEVKKNAWRAKIEKKLARLDKFSPNFFPLYYQDKRDDFFEKFRYTKLKKKIKQKAEKYCEKRQTLEALLDDKYIDDNILILNVRYAKVSETHFNGITSGKTAYREYHTKANPSLSAGQRIGIGILIAGFIAFLSGSIKLTIDEATAQEMFVTVFSIIINTIFDVGFTLWKFVAGVNDCKRIVRQEDLRSALDQNELLTRFSETLGAKNEENHT
ncbi:MAG: hypothetical protein J6V66_03590 [Clostridia bacterium]|nr:hypothetical protein [Clostridia bacterium]